MCTLRVFYFRKASRLLSYRKYNIPEDIYPCIMSCSIRPCQYDGAAARVPDVFGWPDPKIDGTLPAFEPPMTGLFHRFCFISARSASSATRPLQFRGRFSHTGTVRPAVIPWWMIWGEITKVYNKSVQFYRGKSGVDPVRWRIGHDVGKGVCASTRVWVCEKPALVLLEMQSKIK